MRTSSYVIYCDLPDNKEEMLLVHGYSGAFDKVSRNVASFLRAKEARRPPPPLHGFWTPENSPSESPAISSESTAILLRRGYLTTLSLEQEESLFRTIVEKAHDKQSRTPSYIFMPTYDCNLRCAYCFQDHMRTNPAFRHLLHAMSPALIDRIFKGIGQIEEKHQIPAQDRGARRIGFFGGEPLLAKNRLAVNYIIEKALALGPASIWAVSNATELDAYKDILSPSLLSSIQITLDGPPAEHDTRRIYPDRSGSFERIADNITMALDRGVGISVRVNVDRNNIGQLPALADEIHRRGWDDHAGFSAYSAPIRAENDNVQKSTTLDSWELDQELDRRRLDFPLLNIISRPDDGLKQLARRIFADPANNTVPLRESFCSAHTGMYIFDCFADIYACWERTGDSSVRIGHINDDGDLQLNSPLLQMWRTRTVASNPVCVKCRYALHCGGGCAVLALGKTGKYHMNYCDGFASRLRSSVGDAYLEHISGKALAVGKQRVCDQ